MIFLIKAARPDHRDSYRPPSPTAPAPQPTAIDRIDRRLEELTGSAPAFDVFARIRELSGADDSDPPALTDGT